MIPDTCILNYGLTSQSAFYCEISPNMPFFGLFWATSWVSYFLTSSQVLLKVPDYFVSAFPANVFSVVSSPLEIPTPLFSTQLYSEVWSSNSSVAAIPNLGFHRGTSSSQFRPQPTITTVDPTYPTNAVENVFCRPESEPKEDYIPVAPQPQYSSASWRETSPNTASKPTLPQQIWQVMQNLLPRRQHVGLTGQVLASSVKVVSTHSLEEVGNQQNSEGKHVKRGFWQYSQQLAKRVFATPTSTEEEWFQVWVKEQLIAQFPDQQQAELMAQRLKEFLSASSEPNLQTSPVEPTLFDNLPAVKVGARLLFKVDDALATALNRNPELLAIEWANNLRIVLGKVPLKLAEAQRRMYNLVETTTTFKGRASWYGPRFHGRATATGETYNQHELTAAHPSLPFDTYLKVRNLNNGNSVIVRINDRGPYVPNRMLDLSREAARCIEGEKVGIVRFEAVVMQQPSPQSERYLVRN